ncbi:MAG: protein-L-isoaspartate(D-aspartate) O-methyltransferase [Thermoplasmata archaeon]
MTDRYGDRRERMVERLLRDGVLRTPRIIEAMEAVPRHLFVSRQLRESAYYDTPLTIGSGQTISAPHMVGMMLEYLDLQEGQSVLEIGGGSGYHAALVAEIVGPRGRVVAVERIASLAKKAQNRLEKLGLADRVKVTVRDGSEGFPGHAPFDRIFVTCGAPEIPPPLIRDLREGGKLLIPVGTHHFQDLILGEKMEGELNTKSLGGVVFVPLVGAFGFD